MPYHRMRWLVASFAFGILQGCAADPIPDSEAAAFKRLAEARSEHERRVLSHLESLWDKALSAETDPVLTMAFEAFHQSRRAQPARAVDLRLVASLEERYVTEYGEFYDILFVARDGLVFHTVKMESDFGRNFFTPPLEDTRLSRTLRGEVANKFVDFEIYSPSSEAAAFFIVPVGDPGDPSAAAGWMVFQLAVNSLNRVLRSWNLGVTGEVYLTTEQGLMITRSRFVPTDDALSIVVDTESMRAALDRSEGQIITEDYRGVSVLSSFGTVTFKENTWVIFAEMDEDEVVSERFAAREAQYLPRLLEVVGAGEPEQALPPASAQASMRVDINEYGRGNGNAILSTFGVATCTGVIITYPGRFTYLGHVPPTDISYDNGWGTLELGAALLGYETGDLLGEMLDRIKRHDIFPSELGNLRVTLVAVHDVGFANLVRRFLEEGFFLSQITILHELTSEYANIYSSASDGRTIVEWQGSGSGPPAWTTPGSSRSLGSLMSEIGS